MEWISTYATIAVLVATVSIVMAEWARDAHVAAPDRPGMTAIVAGLLWPVLAVGMVQVLTLIGVRHGLRIRAGSGCGRRRTPQAGVADSLGQSLHHPRVVG